MFISSHTTIYFFVKKFIFSNVYISVNAIFKYLYMFFGWKRGHQLSTYATGGEMGVVQNAYSCVQGEGLSRLLCIYILHYLLSCFGQHFCILLSCFISRNLPLPIFLQWDQFLSLWKKLLFYLNYFWEPKLAKTLLILIKWNHRYTQGIRFFVLFNKLFNVDI